MARQSFTQPLAEAIADAERIITEAAHVRTEQDLAEGYDYLAGSIQRTLQAVRSSDPEFPRFATAPDADTKYGLDNPDTLYYGTRIRADADYIVTGRRGTTADLSFQVLGGDYTPAQVPDSLAAFDDRALEIAEDGSFEVHFGPQVDASRANSFRLGEGAAILVIREVYSDWEHEHRGTIRIHRPDNAGHAPKPPTPEAMAKRFAAAGKLLVGQLQTFLRFPERFYLDLPVNTMTEPRLTPGGLATQYSSVGHYELGEDQAMIVDVPRSEAPYQGFQLGSMWYVSHDYANHQTSLTADQARTDPDDRLRFVVSERDPGVANWLACTGHGRGYLQIRWQRVSRELTAEDGPTVQVVGFDELPRSLPYYARSTVTPQERIEDIARRQAALARRRNG